MVFSSCVGTDVVIDDGSIGYKSDFSLFFLKRERGTSGYSGNT